MKVSVIIAAYNHERFVAKTLRSVLDQTYQNFEIILVDDGSTDKTFEIAKNLSDNRITLKKFEKNQGACAATNAGIALATGEFICILSSDDCWKRDKLEKQIRLFKEDPTHDLIFGFPDFIDDDDRPLDPDIHGLRIFFQKNRSRKEWIRRLFLDGNCFCHPTLMIRRKCYDEVGGYDNSFRQLPDFQMWTRLIGRYRFHVMQEPLIDFRIHSYAGGNTSGLSQANSIRTWNELFVIAGDFLSDLSDDLFFEAFRSELRRPDRNGPSHRKIEEAFLFLRDSQWLGRIYNKIGYNQMMHLIRDPKLRSILKDDYQFTELDLQNIATRVLSFLPGEEGTASLAANESSLDSTSGYLLAKALLKKARKVQPTTWRKIARKIWKYTRN